MRILAIDPSSTCIGYATFDTDMDGRLLYSGHSYIKGSNINDKLAKIRTLLRSILPAKCDKAVVEINISCYSRNILKINYYQFITGYIVGVLKEMDIDVVLIPVSEWKGRQSEDKIAEYAKLVYDNSIKNKDELTAIWLGHWYISQLKIRKSIL